MVVVLGTSLVVDLPHLILVSGSVQFAIMYECIDVCTTVLHVHTTSSLVTVSSFRIPFVRHGSCNCCRLLCTSACALAVDWLEESKFSRFGLFISSDVANHRRLYLLLGVFTCLVITADQKHHVTRRLKQHVTRPLKQHVTRLIEADGVY